MPRRPWELDGVRLPGRSLTESLGVHRPDGRIAAVLDPRSSPRPSLTAYRFCLELSGKDPGQHHTHQLAEMSGCGSDHRRSWASPASLTGRWLLLVELPSNQ